MKVKVFKFIANKFESDKFNSFNCEDVESEINIWISAGSHTIIDIKVNTVEYDYYIGIIYTVLYR